jgi:hypothetical protein
MWSRLHLSSVLTFRDINVSITKQRIPISTKGLSSQTRLHTFLLHFLASCQYLIADALILVSGYIGEFEIIDDHRSGKIVIQLNGRLNKTGVISPRFNVQVTQIENWVNLLLPSRGFGIIILVRLCCCVVCEHSDFMVRRPRRVSWTMRRHVVKMLEENCWDTCIKAMS